MAIQTKTVRLSAEGVQKIHEAAEMYGMTVRQYLEALMHYGLSCYERPGSWEANEPFHPGTYAGKHSCADRWFS
jgi:hypothetical protein